MEYRKNVLAVSVGMALSMVAHSVLAAPPTTWTTTIDSATYGSFGTITFNDWGYTGPTGVGANNFQVGSGFNASQIGQKQNVLTLDPNWLTSDPAKTVVRDALPPSYASVPGATFDNASMDATVNFYAWAYTTVGGSTFTNMQIDKAGNYFVARNDMNFKFYDVFKYHDVTGTNPDQNYDTAINFKPYAISDAKGWCGSVLNANPNGVGSMAGQVTFDFAFDAYMLNGHPSPGVPGGTQIVPKFVMRSYGDYDVSVTVGTDVMHYVGHAVGNNTDPTSVVPGVGGTLSSAWQNKVSFLGAGVVPKGVWVTADSFNPDGSHKLNADSTWAVTLVNTANQTCDPNAAGAAPAVGAVCWQNSFAGYPFLMRADGQRTLTFIDVSGHSNYVATDFAAYTSIGAVPVPAAVWLLGSGLAGLGAFVRRRKI